MSMLYWRLKAFWFALTAHPIRGGADDDDKGDDKGEDDKPADDKQDDKSADDDKSDDADAAADDDKSDDDKPAKTAEAYRQELRNYERNAKRASAKDKKEIEKLKSDLKKREDADKSEQEKAIEAAREEGRTAAQTAAEKERRQDRLEVAAMRLASKGVKVGEGDDAKTVKFADPEDALVHLERAISRNEVDADSVFDDNGRVKDQALTDLLSELLENKPHLRETGEEKPQRTGDADAGKGAGDGAKSLDEMSTEEHLQRIKRHKD